LKLILRRKSEEEQIFKEIQKIGKFLGAVGEKDLIEVDIEEKTLPSVALQGLTVALGKLGWEIKEVKE